MGQMVQTLDRGNRSTRAGHTFYLSMIFEFMPKMNRRVVQGSYLRERSERLPRWPAAGSDPRTARGMEVIGAAARCTAPGCAPRGQWAHRVVGCFGLFAWFICTRDDGPKL